MVTLAPSAVAAHLSGPAGQPAVQVEHLRVAVLHDRRRTDLALEVEYTSEEPPRALGWIVPVPSAATGFATLDGSPFPALSRAVDAPTEPSPLAPVGPYAIQRVPGRGENAVTALGRWLAAGELAAPDRATLDYYAERGWSFVAVRIRPADGARTLPVSGRLPPLIVSFHSDRPVAPLKLAGPGGPRSRLFLLTERPMPAESLAGARERGFEALGQDAAVSPATAPELAALLSSSLAATGGPPRFRLTALGATLGEGAADSSAWDEDLAFPAADTPLTATIDHPPARPSADAEERNRTAEAPASPPRGPGEGGGCGCGVTPSGAHPMAALGALATLALLSRRRRRSA